MGKGKIPRERTLVKQEADKKAKSKKQKRNASTDPNAPKNIPRTIENSRPVTQVPTEEEFSTAFENDAFTRYFKQGLPPKILITTVRRASKQCYHFAHELGGVFHNAQVETRKSETLLQTVLKEAMEAASYTDVVVLGQRLKEPYSLTLVHLPAGPTAIFRLRSLRTAKSIRNHGNATQHPPELIMNHFTTMLGATVGRFLMSLFPPQPQFTGRQVVTFHHQRDFIFFRRHRYVFAAAEPETGTGAAETQADPEAAPEEPVNGTKVTHRPKQWVQEKVRLQELGPRFTLKLQVIRDGIRPDAPILWARQKGMSSRKDAHL